MGDCCGPCHDAREAGMPPRRSFRLVDPEAGVVSVAFAPDGGTLATRNAQERVRLWDVATCAERALPEEVGSGLAFSPDGRDLIVTAMHPAGAIRVWDVETRQLRRNVSVRAHSLLHPAYSPDGRLLAVYLDGRPALWDTDAWEFVGTFNEVAPAPDFLVFSPDGKTLAVRGSGAVSLCDVDTRRRRGYLPLESSLANRIIPTVAFAPDGTRLAFAVLSVGVLFWQFESGKVSAPLPGSEGTWPNAVRFSPDGGLVLARCGSSLTVWGATTGAEQITLEWPHGLSDFAVSPSGELLATAHGSVTLWARAVFAGDAGRHPGE
jgi:Tol biopolymer transport system component